MKRITIGIILLLSTLLFHWWVPILIALFCLFYFDDFYEILVVGLLIDVLYGSKFEFYGFNLFFTLLMLVFFYTIGKFRKQILI